MKPRALAALAVSLPMLSACLLVPAAPPPTRIIPAPPVCSIAAAASLQLPATESAPQSQAKSEPLSYARVHTVNRPLQEIAVWQGFENGWSRLSLQLSSRYARSLSLRLRDTHLPAQSAVWLCSASGALRQGPLVADAQAELWTPVLPGELVRLEVWVPSALRAEFSAQLSDVYAAYP